MILTLAQLDIKHLTLNQVDDLFYDGQISEATANEFFKIWVDGKMGHRWNETLKRPEHLICISIYTGEEKWVEMRWS
jgi:hypothetical protein